MPHHPTHGGIMYAVTLKRIAPGKPAEVLEERFFRDDDPAGRDAYVAQLLPRIADGIVVEQFRVNVVVIECRFWDQTAMQAAKPGGPNDAA